MGVRKWCLLCGNSNLEDIIDLGMHPLADLFIRPEYRDIPLETYPLVVTFCPKCWQLQLKYRTEPELRYNDPQNTYSYTAGNSTSSRKYWQEFAKTMVQGYQPKKVLEIGSNDGTLLGYFKELGCEVRGCEASYVMMGLSKENYQNIPIDNCFFGMDYAKTVGEQFDLIVANNVANHADYLADFMFGIKKLLTPNGTVIIEVPYWGSNIEQGTIDTIYHEHVTYWTVTFARRLFEAIGLELADVTKTPYHGGSLQLVGKLTKGQCLVVEQLIKEEQESGMFDPKFYEQTFMPNIIGNKCSFLEMFYHRQRMGFKAVAIGAAAKGNTLLNFYGLNNSVIDYVTDSSPMKIGKYTPLSNIPITTDDVLTKYDEVDAIILARNLPTSLQFALQRYNKKVRVKAI